MIGIIYYIYVGTYEKIEYNPNQDTLNRLNKVASFGYEDLYKI